MASVPDIHSFDSEGIQDLCAQIADGQQANLNCPCCSAALRIVMSSQGIGVSCPSDCFNFDCRREPNTGAFIDGFLDFPGSNCTLAAGQA